MRKVTVDAYGLLAKVRAQSPLVHHLTNWVTIYDCANIVKVFGASPVMAHAPEEVEEMAGMASALVLNIGTLTADFVDAMKRAAKAANKNEIPVVLDVCGAGATRFRDVKASELLDEAHIDIIKGNASEIARIAGENAKTRGVDAAGVYADAAPLAERLARMRRCTVAMTGAVDIVTDGSTTYFVKNGHPLMGRVVGTGCMAASVIGTFAAVEKSTALAAVAGLVCFEIAAERAVKAAGGPGSFKEALFDAVYTLDKNVLTRMQKVYA